MDGPEVFDPKLDIENERLGELNDFTDAQVKIRHGRHQPPPGIPVGVLGVLDVRCGRLELLVCLPHLEGDPQIGKILLVDQLHVLCPGLVDPPLRDPEVEVPIEAEEKPAL